MPVKNIDDKKIFVLTLFYGLKLLNILTLIDGQYDVGHISLIVLKSTDDDGHFFVMKFVQQF